MNALRYTTAKKHRDVHNQAQIMLRNERRAVARGWTVKIRDERTVMLRLTWFHQGKEYELRRTSIREVQRDEW